MRKALITLAIALVAAQTALTGTGLAQTPFEISKKSQLAEIVGRGKLVVGMELKFWPFEYTDEKGQPVGLDVDVARQIAKDMGVELEIKDMEWTGLIPALQGGKIDLIISGITGTLERAKSITFTDAYFTTGLCALLSSKRAGDLTKAEQLNAPGRVIAVKTGTTADTVATARFPKAQINRYKDETACVQEVVNGRADAFFYDQISVAKHARQNPESTKALLTPFTYEPYCIAMRKGDFDLWNWLQMFISVNKANGRMEEIRKVHLGELF